MKALGLLGCSLVLLGLGLIGVVGVARGREVERHKPLLSRLETERRREAFEKSLQSRTGLPMMHRDPENAGKLRKARISR